MPTATAFNALQLQKIGPVVGNYNGFPSISGTADFNEFRFEMPLSTAVGLFWNAYTVELDLSYTHTINRVSELKWIESKTASESPNANEPKDRITGANWEIDVGASGTIDTEFYSYNNAWSPNSFASSFSSEATGGLRLYEGSSASVALVSFKVNLLNRISLAQPAWQGFICNPAKGADIDSNGFDGSPASWWTTHDVTLSLFGESVAAVFASRLDDPANSPTSSLTGFSFEVTQTPYTY